MTYIVHIDGEFGGVLRNENEMVEIDATGWKDSEAVAIALGLGEKVIPSYDTNYYSADHPRSSYRDWALRQIKIIKTPTSGPMEWTADKRIVNSPSDFIGEITKRGESLANLEAAGRYSSKMMIQSLQDSARKELIQKAERKLATAQNIIDSGLGGARKGDKVSDVLNMIDRAKIHKREAEEELKRWK